MLKRHGWIGILIGMILILLPNTFLRTWLPVPGPIPTPTLVPTADPLDLSYQQGVQLMATDPLAALSLLEEVAFSSHPLAESARTLTQAIRSARLADDRAYLFTASGQALAAFGEWKLAQNALLKAVQLDPEYAEAWAYLGEAQQQNGEDGYPSLRRSLDLNPESLSALLFTALYWQRQQDYLRAGLLYHRAASHEPDNASIQLQWGQNALLAGDVNEAREHFDAAAQLSPDDLGTWTYVARFSIGSELFVEELGLSAALRVLREQPENAEAMVLVGRAYSSLGNKIAGRVYLEQAVKLYPEFGPAHYYFGLFLLANEETDQALAHLNKVIELSPGSQEAKLASELIVRYSR
ncbi:MAG TPA: tetratricopeptide repeat protein [Anaerolineales bacterium]|nr:tetratricopeptide repeat protein [Anaerolineales bacterium]